MFEFPLLLICKKIRGYFVFPGMLDRVVQEDICLNRPIYS